MYFMLILFEQLNSNLEITDRRPSLKPICSFYYYSLKRLILIVLSYDYGTRIYTAIENGYKL